MRFNCLKARVTLEWFLGWVNLGATQWFWAWNSWTGNPAPWPLGHCSINEEEKFVYLIVWFNLKPNVTYGSISSQRSLIRLGLYSWLSYIRVWISNLPNLKCNSWAHWPNFKEYTWILDSDSKKNTPKPFYQRLGKFDFPLNINLTWFKNFKKNLQPISEKQHCSIWWKCGWNDK